MRQVNIHEAKTQFSRLLAAVEQGEEIVIARYGQPIAKLVAIRPSASPRKPGTAKGRFTVPPAFFEPLPDEVIEGFER
ncbi:MAG: type II toxin-antitoxin system Phd/YefM family antitoxin [Deltaproteobacteria bacterium]|nr:type II toxin-antitoxin system Phd/YefM family antitoxin [Deltaproteobacteria bacterium]